MLTADLDGDAVVENAEVADEVREYARRMIWDSWGVEPFVGPGRSYPSKASVYSRLLVDYKGVPARTRHVSELLVNRFLRAPHPAGRSPHCHLDGLKGTTTYEFTNPAFDPVHAGERARGTTQTMVDVSALFDSPEPCWILPHKARQLVKDLHSSSEAEAEDIIANLPSACRPISRAECYARNKRFYGIRRNGVFDASACGLTREVIAAVYGTILRGVSTIANAYGSNTLQDVPVSDIQSMLKRIGMSRSDSVIAAAIRVLRAARLIIMVRDKWVDTNCPGPGRCRAWLVNTALYCPSWAAGYVPDDSTVCEESETLRRRPAPSSLPDNSLNTRYGTGEDADPAVEIKRDALIEEVMLREIATLGWRIAADRSFLLQTVRQVA